jgi:hypothetical protein
MLKTEQPPLPEVPTSHRQCVRLSTLACSRPFPVFECSASRDSVSDALAGPGPPIRALRYPVLGGNGPRIGAFLLISCVCTGPVFPLDQTVRQDRQPRNETSRL